MSDTLEQRLSRVKERDVEKAVCDYARKAGFLTYKFTSPNHMSVPDRIFINPDGLIFFIEFKAPGKKATPKQMREMHRLAQQGCHVFLCDDINQGETLVDFLGDSERVLRETREASASFAAYLSAPGDSAPH